VKRRFVNAIILCFLPVLGAAAAPQNLANAEYSFRAWQVEDGLPQNSVTAIAQTRDGYLWIGTYGGLARFDGVRFKTFTALDNPSLEDDDIVSLYEDAKGALWIGHESGAVTCYRNGKFESIAGRAASIRRKVVAISADSDGNIWMLHDGGALQAESDGRVLPRRNPDAAGPLEFVRDAAGELYINRDGRVSLLREGKLESIDFGPVKSSGYVEGFAASADGGLWIVRDSRLKKWKNGRWAEDRGPCQLGENSISAMIEMAGGCVAIGTSENGC
jgi:ligand-binding sensor domain-containing protein